MSDRSREPARAAAAAARGAAAGAASRARAAAAGASASSAGPPSWLDVAFLREMTDPIYHRLRAAFSSTESLFAERSSAAARAAQIGRVRFAAIVNDEALAEARRSLEVLRALGGEAIAAGEPGYPALLSEAVEPPRVLTYVGRVDDPQDRRVAIVGSRTTDRRACDAAYELARALARRDYCVVSGLARGIDTAAHAGAIEGGGPTLAVLGAGLDQIYPPENAALARRIAECGALLSPFAPGTPPLKQNFPRRNLTIAGLSRAVIVVQAPKKSGALITARLALDANRDVLAMPGPVGDPRYAGSNRLLRDGARICLDLGDILAELEGLEAALAYWKQLDTGSILPSVALPDLTAEERALLGAVPGDPLHVDEIARASGLPPASLLPLLLNLEIKGAIESLPGARYAIRSGWRTA